MASHGGIHITARIIAKSANATDKSAISRVKFAWPDLALRLQDNSIILAMGLIMKQILKTVLISTTAVLAVSCGTISTAPSIGSDIVEDALELNDAYGAATNAVILKNILRARDRWPTTYTTLSGIQSSPKLARGGKVGLSPLGLGNAVGPFTGSGSSFSNASSAGNIYTVAPFVAAGGGEAGILEPMGGAIFEKYFHRWPRDIATLLLVNGLRVEEGGRERLVRNDGENVEGFIMDIARGFELSEAQYRKFNIGKHLDLTTTGNDEYAFALRPNTAMGLSARQLDIRQKFELRSIDAIVYYLGETLRTPQTPISVSCHVQTASGYEKVKVKAPLLEVKTAQYAQPVNYAVQVKHAGQTYYALPNSSQVEANGGCIRARSSTVISMLNQLLLLSQNSDAFKGPQTLTLQ